MFEATHSERCAAPASDVWALWSDPKQWPKWNERVERVQFDDELRVGADLKLKYRRGGKARFVVIELEPERLLVHEARFPGARLGYEHRLDPGRSSVEITHRVYVSGRLSGLWALMLDRKRLRESVKRFTRREREITEPGARV